MPVLVAGLGLTALAIWLLAAPKPELPQRPKSSEVPASTPPSGASTGVNAESTSGVQAEQALPAGSTQSPFPPELTYSGPAKDRTRADALREALVALYAGQLAAQEQGGGAPGAAMPLPTSDGNQADGPLGQYIGRVMNEQFVPLAGSCYEQLLEAQPSAAGSVTLEFSIMGDEAVGGVVVDAGLGDGTTLDQPEFATCVKESLLALIFDAPPRGHPTVSVTQNLTFEP